MTEQTEATTSRERDWYGTMTDRVVDALLRMNPGDRAALRRSVGGVPPPAFWRVAFAVLEPMQALPESTDRGREHRERQWSSIVALVERIAEQHIPHVSPGAALGASSSDARFEKLLRADGSVLLDELRAVLHRLRSEGARFDARFVTALVLSSGQRDEERVRRSLARDYYRFVTRAENK